LLVTLNAWIQIFHVPLPRPVVAHLLEDAPAEPLDATTTL
jgi:hypothetical protein